MTKTAGQEFAAELRVMFSIGPRTRWYRRNSFGDRLTRESVMERVLNSVNYPGYDDTRRTAILRTSYSSLCAWVKHVEGFRIDPRVRYEVTEQSPWNWTAYLGSMIDTGLVNSGEFEEWFRQQR
jgi:hypothetical protein